MNAAAVIERKTCTRCGMLRPAADFYQSGKRGLHSWCKPCFRTYVNARPQAPKPRAARTTQHMWVRYRLRQSDFDAMMEAQNGQCAICDKDIAGVSKHRRIACIDHCHETGKVRGILCHKCNVALHGLEQDDWRERALAYLGAHK